MVDYITCLPCGSFNFFKGRIFLFFVFLLFFFFKEEKELFVFFVETPFKLKNRLLMSMTHIEQEMSDPLNISLLKSLLLIPFRSGRNSRNFSYRYANWYRNTPRSTSGQISGRFGPFRKIPANSGRDVNFGHYWLWPVIKI